VLLSFKAKNKESLHFRESSILEAKVVERNENVQVHAEITQSTNELVSDIYFSEMTVDPLLHREMQLPSQVYKVKELSDDWSVISIDSPSHGDSPLLFTADEQSMPCLCVRVSSK